MAEHWRTGKRVARNLYRVTPEHPEGEDIGRMDTPELAAQVVEAVNVRLAAGQDGWDRTFITAMADNTTEDAAAQLHALLADRDHMARMVREFDQGWAKMIEAHEQMEDRAQRAEEELRQLGQQRHQERRELIRTGADHCERADRAEVELERQRQSANLWCMISINTARRMLAAETQGVRDELTRLAAELADSEATIAEWCPVVEAAQRLATADRLGRGEVPARRRLQAAVDKLDGRDDEGER